MKRFLSILLLLALSLSLVSCHKAVKREEFEIPESFDVSRNYEINFWAKNDNNPTQQAIYKKAVADFQELYPNITVNLRLYSDYGKIYDDVITNISTDTTPNVCITYPDHIASYIEGDNTVVPLDALFADKKYGLGGSEVKFDSVAYSEIVPKFLNECKLGEEHYAVPFMRSTEACYVNKTYVEKLGYTLPETLTWDFVWEVSEAAMEKDGEGNYKVNGQKVLVPFIYKSTDNMMIQMLKQQNAGYSSYYGDIELFNDTTKEILYTVAEHAESGAFDTFDHVGYPGNFLNAGQCIFAIDSTAGATWMGSDAHNVDISEDKKADFETVVMAIPQYDVDNPQMISQGPSICVFNKSDPQEVLASWLFAQFMLTNSVQIAYSQTEGYLPVTTKAQNSAEYLDYFSRRGEDNNMYYYVKIDAAKLLLDNIDNTFVTPVFNGSVELRNAAGQLIDNVNVDVRRMKQPINDEYITQQYEKMTTLFHLDETGEIGVKIDFEGLPVGAVVLICAVAICWISMGFYVIVTKIQRKKH